MDNTQDGCAGADPPPSPCRGCRRLLGTSPPTVKLREKIAKASAATCPVLIVGETGTGKELVARAIHDCSARRERPFVPVDCAALVPSLMESELFGHVRGAFSGAEHTKQGLLEAADGGTVFFDEIGELALGYQAKLLRTLQEREVRPVGSTRRIRLCARIIAATNRDLEEGVRLGNFRRDLYYRLNVFRICVPTLLERRADIPQLVAHFLEKTGENPTPPFSDDAMACLVAYDWPGNVRELENVVQSTAAQASGPVLETGDLPVQIARSREPIPFEQAVEGLRECLTLRELERRAVGRAIEKTGGNVLEAAKRLGIGKTTLYRKLKEIRVLSY